MVAKLEATAKSRDVARGAAPRSSVRAAVVHRKGSNAVVVGLGTVPTILRAAVGRAPMETKVRRAADQRKAPTEGLGAVALAMSAPEDLDVAVAPDHLIRQRCSIAWIVMVMAR